MKQTNTTCFHFKQKKRTTLFKLRALPWLVKLQSFCPNVMEQQQPSPCWMIQNAHIIMQMMPSCLHLTDRPGVTPERPSLSPDAVTVNFLLLRRCVYIGRQGWVCGSSAAPPLRMDDVSDISTVRVFTLSAFNETLNHRVAIFALTLLCYSVVLCQHLAGVMKTCTSPCTSCCASAASTAWPPAVYCVDLCVSGGDVRALQRRPGEVPADVSAQPRLSAHLLRRRGL